MRALLLGARGAVGVVIHRELERDGHAVTAGSRGASAGARVDLRGDLSGLSRLAHEHDVVINASGIERPEIAVAVAPTPLVDISATGSYLDALRAAARGPVVLGAGLVPGLSTVLIADLIGGDTEEQDIDVLVMLGTGERHGPAAVAWTASLVGSDVHLPPEGHRVRNLRQSILRTGPDGRVRRYLRADFPDHVLIGSADRIVRTYLTLGSPAMTASLSAVGRMPLLRGLLNAAPHIGTDAWHLVVQSRRSGARRQASGSGQSEATGRLTALAAARMVDANRICDANVDRGPVTMADLITPDDARAVLRR